MPGRSSDRPGTSAFGRRVGRAGHDDRVAAESVEHTEDGHFIIVKGRRWRATDPGLPEHVREQLVHHLMAARRAVAAARDDDTARKAARARVQLAKTGLGERGTAWWDLPLAERHGRADDCLRRLEED
ncbi:Biopolymer transporter Tol OS=Streptomyces alboniger OX=132473 GN=CP975_03235 PE=4 SV=1 [Streptomyces alboniger]